MQQNRVSYMVQHVACNNVAPSMIAFIVTLLNSYIVTKLSQGCHKVETGFYRAVGLEAR